MGWTQRLKSAVYVDELYGEKIDIIKWDKEIAEYISNALSPYSFKCHMKQDTKQLDNSFENQLSLAIGKEGQNARLAARLTGWKIDIKSEDEFNAQEDVRGDESEI